jgi:hypothetical protein
MNVEVNPSGEMQRIRSKPGMLVQIIPENDPTWLWSRTCIFVRRGEPSMGPRRHLSALSQAGKLLNPFVKTEYPTSIPSC